MSFAPVPKISKNQIRKAGDILISPNRDINNIRNIFWAHEVLSKWRACHAYPMNTFRATLTKKIQQIDPKEGIIAQRLKRLPTIIKKLRQNTKNNLAAMQDIAGVRAIVKNVTKVHSLRQIYVDKKRFKHQLIKENDYIISPKRDGYRGIHLIYKYINNQSKQSQQYNGLLLEVQIRTVLQHTWATAVETIGAMRGQNYKSKKGNVDDWDDFFSVTSSAFAYLEKQNLVPGYERLSKTETFKLVATMEKQLDVLNKIDAYSTALQLIESQKGGKKSFYHLVKLKLDGKNSTVEVQSYGREALDQATADYSKAEIESEQSDNIDCVLVSAGPIKLLKRAYPNYFLDISSFKSTLQNIISEVKTKS